MLNNALQRTAILRHFGAIDTIYIIDLSLTKTYGVSQTPFVRVLERGFGNPVGLIVCCCGGRELYWWMTLSGTTLHSKVFFLHDMALISNPVRQAQLFSKTLFNSGSSNYQSGVTVFGLIFQ
jgi:hypothetical protein